MYVGRSGVGFCSSLLTSSKQGCVWLLVEATTPAPSYG